MGLMTADLLTVDFDVPNANLLRHEDYDSLNVSYNMNSLSFEMRLHYTVNKAFARYTFLREHSMRSFDV